MKQDFRTNSEIYLAGKIFQPGEKSSVQIPIGRLPTGTLINLPIHVYNSRKSGPRILISAGIHGDEINGIEIIRRMKEEKFFNIRRGSLVVIPLMNVFGFLNKTREFPDGKDLNRSFPGSKSGSLASRTADMIVKEVLPQIDFGIDFHTGGGMRNNYPQIRYSEELETSKELATLFGSPFNFPSPLISKSFRKTAAKMEKPIVVYEGGESYRMDNFSINSAILGCLKVFNYFDMINTIPIKYREYEKESIELVDRKWIRAKRSGLFHPLISNGVKVLHREKIGYITDTFGNKKTYVYAPFEGYIFCINHEPLVNKGDAIFNIAKGKE